MIIYLKIIYYKNNRYHFVRLIGTIEVAVATPAQRNAIVVFDAREFLLRASDVGAIEFVRTVLTVVVFVADPNFLNALAVTTRKLVVSTRFVYIRKNEQNKNRSVG